MRGFQTKIRKGRGDLDGSVIDFTGCGWILLGFGVLRNFIGFFADFAGFWWIFLTFGNAPGEQIAFPKHMKKMTQKGHFFSIFFSFFSNFFETKEKRGQKNLKKGGPLFWGLKSHIYRYILIFWFFGPVFLITFWDFFQLFLKKISKKFEKISKNVEIWCQKKSVQASPKMLPKTIQKPGILESFAESPGEWLFAWAVANFGGFGTNLVDFSNQASREASNQASGQASNQGSNQAANQASNQAPKQASSLKPSFKLSFKPSCKIQTKLQNKPQAKLQNKIQAKVQGKVQAKVEVKLQPSA